MHTLRFNDVVVRIEDESVEHVYPEGDLYRVEGVEQGSDVGKASGPRKGSVEAFPKQRRPKRHTEELAAIWGVTRRQAQLILREGRSVEHMNMLASQARLGRKQG